MKNSFLIEIADTPKKSKGAPRYTIAVIDLKDKSLDVEKRDFSCSTQDSDFLFNPLEQLGVAIARRFEHNRKLCAMAAKHKKGLVRQSKIAKVEKVSSEFKS